MTSTGEQQQQQQQDTQQLRHLFDDVRGMVQRGRSGRLRLAGKLQQLQADLAGPVGQRNRSLADGLHRELAQLWPRRPQRVVQLAREHVVKEMMKVALCAAGHHGLARGLDNVAISCFSGACRLVTAAGPPAPHGAGWESTALSELRRWTLAEAQGSLRRQLVWVYAEAERASGDVRQRTPRQAPTRDHFRGGPYTALRQRPRGADLVERPTCPLKRTTPRRPSNPLVCFIRPRHTTVRSSSHNQQVVLTESS